MDRGGGARPLFSFLPNSIHSTVETQVAPLCSKESTVQGPGPGPHRNQPLPGPDPQQPGYRPDMSPPPPQYGAQAPAPAKRTWLILSVVISILIAGLCLVLIVVLATGEDGESGTQQNEYESKYLSYVRDSSTGGDEALDGGAVSGENSVLLAAGEDACTQYREVSNSRNEAAMYVSEVYDVTYWQGQRIANGARFYLCRDLHTTY